jgi:hypothetical protein
MAVCLAQAQPAPEQPAPPLPFQFLPLVAIGVAAYLLLFRPERERIRKQQSMQTGLKKMIGWSPRAACTAPWWPLIATTTA